jgi:hypothetical protein
MVAAWQASFGVGVLVCTLSKQRMLMSDESWVCALLQVTEHQLEIKNTGRWDDDRLFLRPVVLRFLIVRDYYGIFLHGLGIRYIYQVI